MLQLRSDLSFCFIGERAVLLDLEADRYFLLRGEPLQTIREAMAGKLEAPHAESLVDDSPHSLFVRGPDGVAPVTAPRPNLSALEASVRPQALELRVRELFAAQYRASLVLKLRGLRATVARWRAVRPAGAIAPDLEKLIAISQFYASKRPLVPLRRGCVPDSLGLMRLIWRHGLDADLLFGARLDPFAAHCWVQSDDHVLSDPVSNVSDFTPVFRL